MAAKDTDPKTSDTDEPAMDRRTGADRRTGERRQSDEKVAKDRRSGQDRRSTERRKRSINQYDMAPDELEFVRAVNRFRERSGNRFPSARDILNILRELGYEKRA